MKKSHRRVPFALAMIILLIALSDCPAFSAEPVPSKDMPAADQKIKITADRLVANTKTGIAQFSGHVRATQGSTVITSDRLEVHYAQDGNSEKEGAAEASIKAVIASGNVVIHFEDKVATTDKAIYRSQAGIFTLTGKQTRVTSGDNVITGEIITVDRKNDRMTVESGNESRVNAVIFTNQGGLAPPIPGKAPKGTPEQ